MGVNNEPDFEVIRQVVERCAVGGKVVLDSRLAKPGDTFFAFVGGNVDGHDYVEGLVAEGVMCVVSDGTNGGVAVESPEMVLQQAAGVMRLTWTGAVVGVTGSCGKSTVTRMLAACFGQIIPEHNFNNHLGLPVSMLNAGGAPSDNRVFECGISERNEMNLLVEILRPNNVIVTNIGASHGQGLGGIQGVAEEKSKLFKHVADSGVIMIPSGDVGELLSGFVDQGRVVCTGEGSSYTTTTLDALHGVSEAVLEYDVVKVRSLPGAHNALNALQALAMISELGLDVVSAVNSLGELKGMALRTQIMHHNDSAVIVDCYNASPDSMESALDLLSTLPAPHTAFLGMMGELGDDELKLHADVLLYAKQLGVIVQPVDTTLYGEESFTKEGAAKAIRYGRGSFLIKGSRSVRMEEILTLANIR